jgi:hypothetical protein
MRVDESSAKSKAKGAKFLSTCISKIINKFLDVLIDDLPKHLPLYHNVDHKIEVVPRLAPLSKPPYQLNKKELQEFKAQINDLMEWGYIKPSEFPYGLPTLFVDKKDEKLSTCINYHALNKIIVKNNYPLPRIEDLFYHLNGAYYFNQIDLKSNYYQISMENVDVEKMVMKTRYGSYEFLVMRFELRNDQSTFTTFMKLICHEKLNKSIILNIDDIFVYSKSVKEHVTHLEFVLQRLKEKKLYANPAKSEFASLEDFLGHELSRERVRLDSRKIESIKKWQSLISTKGDRSFLGLANFYKMFIKDFSALTKPLTNLMKKKGSFEWKDEQQSAFDLLKGKLLSTLVLQFPNFVKPFEMHTDANGVYDR